MHRLTRDRRPGPVWATSADLGLAVCAPISAFGTHLWRLATEAPAPAPRPGPALAPAPSAPSAPPDAPPDAPPQRPPAAAAPQALGTSAGAVFAVLYIDDNPVNTLLMEAMFDRLPGLLLQCELDPHQGLALALAAPPALLLIDIQMPGLDGYQVLHRLRADPATRGVPAIAVSANAMPQDVARGRAEGFADYLTKPLDLARLQTALQAVLPGWQAPD